MYKRQKLEEAVYYAAKSYEALINADKAKENYRIIINNFADGQYFNEATAYVSTHCLLYTYIIGKVKKVFASIKNIKEKIAVWLDDEHKKLYAFLWVNIMKILKKIKPKEFSLVIQAGTGEAYSTGTVAVSYTHLRGSVR